MPPVSPGVTGNRAENFKASHSMITSVLRKAGVNLAEEKSAQQWISFLHFGGLYAKNYHTGGLEPRTNHWRKTNIGLDNNLISL